MFKYRFWILLTTLLMSFQFDTFCQNQRGIDSLNNLLNKVSEKKQPPILNELASRFWFSDPLKSLEYGKKAYQIAVKYDSLHNQTHSTFIIGVSHLVLNNLDSADYYLKISLKGFKDFKDTLDIANNLRALGDLYDSKYNYLEAQKSYFEAYKLFDYLSENKINNIQFYRLYAILLNNMGTLNINLLNHKDAIKYFQKSKIYYRKLNDNQGLSIAELNIGICWEQLGEKDSCINNYVRAYQISKENNVLTVLSRVLMNLGNIYYKENDYKTALKYFDECLPILIKMEDKAGICFYHLSRSRVYFSMGQYNKCNSELKLALKNANENNHIDFRVESYNLLSLSYDSLKDYKLSKYYLEKKMNLMDSINKSEKSNFLIEMDKKFNSEHIDKENARLKHLNEVKEISNNRLTILIFSLLIIISLVVSLLIIIIKRNRDKEQLNKLLNDKNKELELLNSTKDKFFSIIAHDLKNPLGTLKAFTKLIYDSYDQFDDEEIKEYIHNLKESAEGTYNLLENLLEWSYTQKGIISFKPSEIILKELIEKTIFQLRISSVEKGISVSYKVDDDVIIKVDSHMIDTVLRNLLSNSIKFTQSGGSVKIHVNKNYDTEYILIIIEDTGVGISSDRIDKLFKIDENSSTLGTNDEKGTGLGLILCKEFIEKHNGKIWVESEVEKYTKFFFTLPKSF